MNLQARKDLLVRLGHFMQSEDASWQKAKQTATAENAWFTPEFIELSITAISKDYLSEERLQELIHKYDLKDDVLPKKVGLVTAGNIPLVGFHDLLCIFITGHYAYLKLSSKDASLLKCIIKKLTEWNDEASSYFVISGLLKGCDAYIATGSNNSASYFEYYFSKYPHIIRKNRTSVAILTGNETDKELEALADDVYLYFGLGCRNVTKLFVPEHYNFEHLLSIFKKYNYLSEHHKYKNNYDYNLAIHLLNHKYYMSNESILLVEESSTFSPISQLNYEIYQDVENVRQSVQAHDDIQCIVGKNYTSFGAAQRPGICNFADGIDTIQFLKDL
ncbi:MAG: acyl-CoA reductase [Bacteroidota bacterium]|nr:acyl-CoA reductase [Bacteroidota bacterium]